MTHSTPSQSPSAFACHDLSRRDFLSLSAAVGASLLSSLPSANALGEVAGSDTIRVGLIGCGKRGIGAAKNCLESSNGVEIHALADLFPNQVEDAATRFNVSAERCFSGFDAFRQLLATNVNLVILATPPGFRPQHFEAAIDAGKHVFMEKPVAVDPVGCRAVIATAKKATEKGLAVVAGTQRRHQPSYIETIQRIHDGQIGNLVSGACYWNWGRNIWFREKTGWLAGLSDFEWQCWNWYHWDWLSGDHIVEQHVHNIDVMNWVFGGPPARFLGMGGRQNQTNLPGNIWDHFTVELEYPNGARVTSMCRQTNAASERIGERVVGTKGYTDCNYWIKGEQPHKYSGDTPEPLVREHANLIASIRKGEPLNEAERVAVSTLTAIGGRMSAYTGRELSWSWLLNASKLDIFPMEYGPGPGLFPPIAVPGVTPLV